MQIKSAEFVTSVHALDDCLGWDHPEFAFIGRSNVGKSSMINLLTGRHALAKVSATPGKTRALNFFLINQKWGLVDLPGYGFAKASRQDKYQFSGLIAGYIESRPNLRLLFVLIDSRHSPQAIDLEFIAWLSGTGTPYQLVFTKADKLSAGKARANVAQFLEAAGISGVDPGSVIMTSAKTRAGRNQVLGAVRQAMEG